MALTEAQDDQVHRYLLRRTFRHGYADLGLPIPEHLRITADDTAAMLLLLEVPMVKEVFLRLKEVFLRLKEALLRLKETVQKVHDTLARTEGWRA